MSRTFIYARVSTVGQDTSTQVAEIKAAGYEVQPQRIMEENISGTVPAAERPGFQKLLDRLESGDILLCTKLDRLGRDTRDVVGTVEALSERDIHVRCLQLGGVDLTSPAGKMTMTVLAAVATFERELIVERTGAGRVKAMAEGVKFGRKPLIDEDTRETIRERRAAGESVSALARVYDTNRAMIQRITKETTANERSECASPEAE
jgi:putative DNA-invertase from lambdoid prophage Rac